MIDIQIVNILPVMEISSTHLLQKFPGIGGQRAYCFSAINLMYDVSK